MDVGNRIRQLREAKHYTVNGLANRAGVSQSYLRDLELNNKNPTVETLSFFYRGFRQFFFKKSSFQSCLQFKPGTASRLTHFFAKFKQQ